MGLSENDLQQLFQAMFEDLAKNVVKLNRRVKTKEELDDVFEKMKSEMKSKTNGWFIAISDGLEKKEARDKFEEIVDVVFAFYLLRYEYEGELPLPPDYEETVQNFLELLTELFKELSGLTGKTLEYDSRRFSKPLVFKPARVILPAIKQTTEIQRKIRGAYIDNIKHAETGFYHPATGRYFPSHSELMQRLDVISKTNRAKFNTRFSGFYN